MSTTPDLTALRELAAREWGLDPVDARDLGSNEDRNVLLTLADGGRRLLKVSHAGVSRAALEAQDAALARLAADPAVVAAVPRVHPTRAGTRIVPLGDGRHARVLDFLDGAPPIAASRLPEGMPATLGAIAGGVTAALAGLDHPGLESGAWDLRRAREVLDGAAAALGAEEHARLGALLESAGARIADVTGRLQVQAVHGDLTADNVLVDAEGAVTGIIDLGDVGLGWAVGEAAILACGLLQHDGPAVRDALDAVAAFDAIAPLTDEEVVALWPLVIARAVVLAAAGERVLADQPDNAYARARRPLEARMLERATSLGLDEAELLVRHALGRVPEPASRTFTPMIAGLAEAAEVDLSVTSPAYDAGAWLEAGTPRSALAAERGEAAGALSRYGERLLLPEAAGPGTPRSRLAGRAIAVSPGTPVVSPNGGVVTSAEGDALTVRIDYGPAVHVRGVVPRATAGTRVVAGEALARAAEGPDGTAVVLVWQSVLPDLAPPPRVAPGHDEAWEALCPDPAPLLGRVPANVASSRSPQALLDARDHAFARVQEHYYAAPPRIERGWRHHLLDTDGRGYLDMVNNVAILGHGESRIADAVARQLRLLNTNSRFHYEAVVAFSEELAARAPDGLDTVLLVNSGSEAVDLAIRIARAATGRTDILALTEAYHGWTVGADAISTSLGDNPGALESRPGWVHLLDAPNAYRGRHRGADAGRYLEDALVRLAELDGAGVELAGLVAEPIFGNGGGILLPDGYLAGLADAVHARGGIVVADEVQVSYGRLGAHFWGFEQQGVEPDVIAVAKAMGNGHPLGAVITTRAIAEAFAVEGSFFSSAGGSPVSCVVGSTVLRVLDEDGLQENARVMGDRLHAGLLGLCEHFPGLGAVHGMGLYLGVEVVAGGPDAPDPDGAREICEALLEEGVIVQPTGDHKNVLKIKPPLTIGEEAVARFLDALERVMVRRKAWAAL
ncbi:aminotransferase [Demequina sp. SYSU T00192]|uniref:Aminotransferase n=1 Tax=Demequina litoralis TaxID=3051660 RepID=A0ABT8GA48_9MICO|nr:aminotransferase [Demequina sp. SYSU T00192]MDN4475867.1 aminotransferase [Demequina sp. SYSU T00192]